MKDESSNLGKMNSIITINEVAEPTSKSSKSTHRSSGRRTHRACDRCRVKKSKCNGQQPCNTCKANERTCVFSALRRRDIRKWHCHMQDTVDEAIQRLYKACKESASFPGTLPDEKDGYVTTESILIGMGFTNLDLGPRANGFPPNVPSQSLPLRSRYSDLSYGTSHPVTTHLNQESDLYRISHSDGSSEDAATSIGSPHLRDRFDMSPVVPGHFDQRSTGIPISMAEQFHEAAANTIHHPQHYHHHSIPPSLPAQHPQVVHFSGNENGQTTNLGRAQNVSLQEIGRSQYSYEFREQYPPQMYYGGPFINPQQVWPGHNEMMAVSQ